MYCSGSFCTLWCWWSPHPAMDTSHSLWWRLSSSVWGHSNPLGGGVSCPSEVHPPSHPVRAHRRRPPGGGGVPGDDWDQSRVGTGAAILLNEHNNSITDDPCVTCQLCCSCQWSSWSGCHSYPSAGVWGSGGDVAAGGVSQVEEARK